MPQTLSRTKTVEVDPNSTTGTPPSSSTGQPSLSPSFSEVLEGLSDPEDVDPSTRWARVAVPDCYIEGRKSITFQKLDIRESNDEYGRSEIHLFGVTKSGHSILTRVYGFGHYCYYPASPDISEDDLDPLRDYLNSVLGTPVISLIEFQKQKVTKDSEEASFLKISLIDHREMKRLEDMSFFVQTKPL
ncbi:hypothetical protein D9619_007144 [Psilocybe cf. subviscida]|uniref:Uncharacterized protein n=1 Tax=Psilocybe cf. subviscida TaxID=2480587 RepID=A0A8H5EWJ0_9AGAR|nr:hypothetical protein D9619_007144 [Psilocybe cf. subviscida]